MGTVPVDVELIDSYNFFLRVPTEQITPKHEDGTITNIPQNWQFPGDEPKNVIGCSTDGTHFIFYVETDTQTRTRVKHL